MALSAGILLLLFMSVIGAILATTQTSLGRARLRSLINTQVQVVFSLSTTLGTGDE